jgi:hypothetical protein
MNRRGMSLFLRQQAVERFLDSRAVRLKKLWDAHVVGAAGTGSKSDALSVQRKLGGFIFGLERLRDKFAIRLLQQNFHAAFRLFELLLTLA